MAVQFVIHCTTFSTNQINKAKTNCDLHWCIFHALCWLYLIFDSIPDQFIGLPAFVAIGQRVISDFGFRAVSN